jgi:two-component system, OmpR family, alkaline phosphatase synthesis response regulator PhoP
MPKEHILIVDDEEDILELLEYTLSKEGFSVTCATSGEDAIKIANSLMPDLILIDLILPGIDGFELTRLLKNDPETSRIPVIMLTAKAGEPDIVTGLELGADDYITKPFSPRILVARVKALLRIHRQARADESSTITYDDLVIRPNYHEVTVKGKAVNLTTTQFQILCFLARRPGWVYSRKQILEEVYGKGHDSEERAIDVQIVGLRKELDACGHFIETVRGVGYKFKRF